VETTPNRVIVDPIQDDPEYCRLYAYLYGNVRLLVSGGAPLCAMDGTGYVYVDVARGATVNVVVSWGDSRGTKDHVRVEVPDLPLLNIGPLVCYSAHRTREDDLHGGHAQPSCC
jgi:hypothetical protein